MWINLAQSVAIAKTIVNSMIETTNKNKNILSLVRLKLIKINKKIGWA